jgi:hypothetical protein
MQVQNLLILFGIFLALSNNLLVLLSEQILAKCYVIRVFQGGNSLSFQHCFWLFIMYLYSFTVSANEQGLWQVGVLKLVRPNVCRYKLLIGVARAIELLKNAWQFPSAETKRGRPCGTIKFLMFNYFRQPPIATNPCWWLPLFVASQVSIYQ